MNAVKTIGKNYRTKYRMTRAELKAEIYDIFTNQMIKNSTSNTYANDVLRMIEEVYGFDNFKMSNLTTDIDKIEQYIRALPTKACKQMHIAIAILKLVKSIPGFHQGLIKRYERIYEDVKEKDTLARLDRQWSFPKEPETMWQEIKAKINGYPKIDIQTLLNQSGDANIRNFMNRYIGLLYTLHPPIRHSEWISAIFLDIDDGKSNHVNLNKGELVIYDQKSFRSSVRINKLSPALVEEMVDMRKLMNKIYPKNNIEYVLPKYEKGYGQPESSTISEKIERILGYGTNQLRKIYEGVVYKNADSNTYLYVVKSLGHSVETSKKDYLKDLKRNTVTWPTHGDHFAILELKMHSGRDIYKPPIVSTVAPVHTIPSVPTVTSKDTISTVPTVTTKGIILPVLTIPSKVKCAGKTKLGLPCGAPVKRGNTHCHIHTS